MGKSNARVLLIPKYCRGIVVTVRLHILLCDNVYPRVFHILNTIRIIRRRNYGIRVGMYAIDVVAYLLVKPTSSIFIINRAQPLLLLGYKKLRIASSRYAGYHSGCYFEYDAVIDGVCHVSMIEGDLCKLIRVKDSLKTDSKSVYDIVCYPELLDMIQEYLIEFHGKNRISFRTVTIEQVHDCLFEE